MAITYNAPPGTPSGIDGAGSSQMNVFFWQRKALIEAAKEMYFTPLADVTAMPKNYGKTIKCYHYMPLLDDRNINDQGIDAAGATILSTRYSIIIDKLTSSNAVQADADAKVTAINAVDAGVAVKSGAGPWIVTLSRTILNATGTLAQANAILAQYPLASIKQLSGNLYGSSKDIGTIGGKLPTLGENGGRVNRVGFTRILREGTITKFGFFTEWTQDAMDFDSDDELYAHLSRELVVGATQLTEAVLQKDLIAGAGVIVYAGAATTNGTITGEAGNPSIVDYADLMRLARILTDNRTPKQTKIITGSRMIDTVTISAGRVLYIGSELESVVKGMTDLFAAPAFIPVSKYGDAGTILNGEIGTVDQFRIVVVPEMLSWTGVGATVVSNPGYMESGGKYNVYPMLVVGDGAFTTIGFQTGGKMMKFVITTKMPGKETADRNDPYGETGFSSIKWFYGTMMLRPERLALIKTIAKI